MKIKYIKDTDYMYIHFKKGIPNILVQTDHEDISKFVSKKDPSTVVGYEIEEASLNISNLFLHYPLTSRERLAVLICFIREKRGETQKQFSTLLGLSESKYKMIENGEHNISFDTVERIYNVFPDFNELSMVFNVSLNQEAS